ncbi:MAG TPA: F0F1 ATP synthase assembly protein [Caulobacteraceae bacterium]|nr:F0F1 ATP synthase assembly protein [Caulobacteraceae bacterium]
MSQADDPRNRAQQRLGRDLDAFEASRAKPASQLAGLGEAGVGYRLLAGLLGGVLGGLGLGWTFDHFVHTSPLGLISGLLIGLGVSIFAAVRTALAISAKAQLGAPPPAVADEDED